MLLFGLVASSLLLTLAVIAFSLFVLLVASSTAAQRQQRTAEIVHAADRQGHAIDNALMQRKIVLEGLAEMTEHLWDSGVENPGTLYDRPTLSSGTVPADWGHSPRYTYPSTFTDFLILYGPTAEQTTAESEVRRLLPLAEAFRNTALRSYSEDALGLSGVPITWLYLGLANGVMVNWPGNNEYGPEFDPTQRPWYTNTANTRGTRWGELYQGASGFSVLLPCNRALYDQNGQFFGVAGLDTALDTIMTMLESDREEVLNTYLVDTEGRIVVSTAQEGLNLGRGLHDNKALARQPFPIEVVREQILANKDSGWVDAGNEFITFDRLSAVDWYFVTIVDDSWF